MVSVITGSNLQTDISSMIDSVGTQVEVYNYSPTYNDRGDAQSPYNATADSTPTVIPVSTNDAATKERYGEPIEGEPAFIFKGDSSISEGDKIVWDSRNYKVVDTDTVPLSGTTVVTHVSATLMDNT